MFILSILGALLLSGLVFWLLYRADKKRAVPYPLLTAGLRGLLTFLCLLLLLAPKINKRNTEVQKPIVLLLQDNSRSVQMALGDKQKEYNQKLGALIKQFPNDYTLVTWNLQGAVDKDSLDQYKAGSTDLATAISEASELYGRQNLSALILASDGWYNEGTNPLYTDIPINTSLYAIAIGDTAIAQDIRIAKVYANKTASLNSQWEIRADILATGCTGTRQNVSLSDAAGNVIATAPVQVTNDRFDATVSFSVKVEKAGLQQYTLSIPKVGNEPNIMNNKTSVFVTVIQEKKKILVLAAAPHPDIKALSEALENLEQYELIIRMNPEIPADFDEYACIILHQLPSNNTNITEAGLRGKGVWYIAGVQNNYFQLNSLQKAAGFSMGIAPHNTDASYNKGFSTFIVPENIVTVTDILPPLSVAVREVNAAAAAQVLFQDEYGKPLWLVLPGSTPIAVTCGEGIWRWRIYEFKNFAQHHVIDECIRQTINFLTANNNNKPFRTELSKYVWNNPEHVTMSAFLYNANNETVNQPEAGITLSDSSGTVRHFSFERSGSSYRIDFGALPAGNYQYSAQTTFGGKTLTDEGRFAVETGSLEDRETGCNYKLLYSLAQKNRGATFDTQSMMSVYDSIAQNNTIKPVLSERIEAADLIDWKWLCFLILAVATAEWLLRKYWMAM